MLLVIACPCALAIATPVTVVSGLVTGAEVRHGILVKGSTLTRPANCVRLPSATISKAVFATMEASLPVATNGLRLLRR